MFIVFLMGVAIGAGFALLMVFLNYKVKDREWWEKQERAMETAHSCTRKLVAENAQLRVAFAAAEVTEDAKKVATMAMAAFETNITATETFA